MSRTISDVVFTLKQIAVGEADSVFVVFGENTGKKSIFAKGIRRLKSRKRGNLVPGYFSDVLLFDSGKGGMLFVSEATLLEGLDLTSDIEHATRLLFLLSKLLPEEVQEVQIFHNLRELVRDGISVYNLNKFRVKFLEELGYISPLYRCDYCGSSSSYLSSVDFSTVCVSCYTEGVGSEYLPLKDVTYSSNIITEILDKLIDSLVWG